MDHDSTLSDLKHELAEIRFGLFMGAILLLIVLMIWNLAEAMSISKAARHFEDVYGSLDKLPVLTNWVIAYGRWGEGYLPFAFICSFTIATVAVMNLTRRSSQFVWIAAIAIAVLVAHWAVVALALSMPYSMLIGPLRSL